MDFLSQIAEYCSAFSTLQVLAALPSRSVFFFSSEYCSAFSTLQVLAALPSRLCFFLAPSIVLRLALSKC